MRANHCAGERRVAAGRVRLPAVLRWFWVGSVVAFAAMVMVGWVEYRMGYPRAHYNPLGGARYQDLMEFVPVFRLAHTAGFFAGVGGSRVAYPPLGAVVYAVLYGTGHAVAVYLAVAVAWIAAGLWGVRRELVRRGIGGKTATLFPLTVAAASFPVAGMVQRGNIELFVWMLVGVGVWTWWRGWDDAAAGLWGLAAAVKLYPVVMLLLFMPQRRWKALGVGVVALVGATCGAMWWLGPSMGMVWRGCLGNVFGYQGVRVGQWSLHELAANHSAFGLVKVVAMMAGVPLDRLTATYYVCGAVMFAVAWFARLGKMPKANQLLGVTTFMMMLPPVSYFYTLVQLYAAWVVLVFVAIEAERREQRMRGIGRAMALLLGIFASFMLFTFPRVYLFGGLVQGAMLVALFGCSMGFRFGVSAGWKARHGGHGGKII